MINQIAQWLKNSISETGKKRIIENVEKANSQAYKMQVAEHHFINSVIDDILADPFWYEIAVAAIENKG